MPRYNCKQLTNKYLFAFQEGKKFKLIKKPKSIEIQQFRHRERGQSFLAQISIACLFYIIYDLTEVCCY